MTKIIKLEILADKKNIIEDLIRDRFENEQEKLKSLIYSLEIYYDKFNNKIIEKN